MISFSQEVKNELCTLNLNVLENKKAELSAVILLCAELVKKDNKKAIKVTLTNHNVVRRFYKLIKEIIVGVNVEIVYKNKSVINKNYDVIIENEDNIVEQTLEIDLFFPDEFPPYLKTPESKLSFIRGVFFARGSITNPQKGYNVNIATYDNEFSDQFLMLCHEFDLNFKKIERNRSFSIYTKGGEQIGDFLRYMGSTQLMYEFENIRIIRDAKNYATRTSNFDNANITKIIKTSQEIIKIIKLVQEKNLLPNLKKRDAEIIRIRLEHPEYSLNQICEELEELGLKASKSTISTFFKKLKDLVKDEI